MYDEAVLALMTCFCADQDLNENEAKWGPESLHKVLDSIKDKDDDDALAEVAGKLK